MASWVTITLDTTPPQVEASLPEVELSRPFELLLTADEPLSPHYGVFRLFDSAGSSVRGEAVYLGQGWRVSFNPLGLEPGVLRLYFSVEDEAGNKTSQELPLFSPAATFRAGPEGGLFEYMLTFGRLVLDVPEGAFGTTSGINIAEDGVERPTPDGDYLLYRQFGSAVYFQFENEPAVPVRVSLTLPGFEYLSAYILKLSDGASTWQDPLERPVVGSTVSFEVGGSGTYGVFYNDFPLSPRSLAAFEKWPRWSGVERRSDSPGRKFINVQLIEIDRLFSKVEEDARLIFLETCPLDLLDIVYRADLPELVRPGFALEFVGDDGRRILEVRSAEELARAANMSAVFVDYQKRSAYFSMPHESVKLTGWIETPEGVLVLPPTVLRPAVHHVWNMFDEFGLLLGTPRLYAERNHEYRERLLATNAYPAGPTREGLAFGIARLLGLIKWVHWPDDSVPLVIPERVRPGSVRVDLAPTGAAEYGEESCTVWPLTVDDGSGQVRPKSHTVHYIPDVVHVHTLGDPKDARLKELLYGTDGAPTAYHRKLAETINRAAPIMWDYFRFDEAYWDSIDRSFTGTAFVPNLYDADVDAWRGYR